MGLLIPEEEDYLELSFDSIRLRGLVSGFVREMGDERDGNLF